MSARPRKRGRRGGGGQGAEAPPQPSVTRADLEPKTVVELRAMATELGLDVKALKLKTALIDAVLEAKVKAEGFIDVVGLLDILPEGYGFLRTSGYLPGDHDVYVSMSMVRRHEMRRGDMIRGQVRPPKETEKYAALQKVTGINGKDPEENRGRKDFKDLTPIYPDEKFKMEWKPDAITTRIIDLVAPIGKGQRGLIVSPPKAGKTTILKDIAAAIHANNPEVYLMCLLVDERPRKSPTCSAPSTARCCPPTFDMPADNHIAVAELCIERAKRLVERGYDVVILLDSITRLGRAYNLASPASGRILSGGVDSTRALPARRGSSARRATSSSAARSRSWPPRSWTPAPRWTRSSSRSSRAPATWSCGSTAGSPTSASSRRSTS